MVTTERVAMEFRILSSRIGADQLAFSKASNRPRNGEGPRAGLTVKF